MTFLAQAVMVNVMEGWHGEGSSAANPVWASDATRPVTDPRHPLHRMPPAMQYPVPLVYVRYHTLMEAWQCVLRYKDGPGWHSFQGNTYNDLPYMIEWIGRLFPTASIRIERAQ